MTTHAITARQRGAEPELMQLIANGTGLGGQDGRDSAGSIQTPRHKIEAIRGMHEQHHHGVAGQIVHVVTDR